MTEKALTPTAAPHAPLAGAEHGSHAFATENRKFAMWLFLGSEVMFFVVLIAAFVYARFKFPDEHNVLNIPLTSLNTFLLLTRSFTVVLALSAAEHGEKLKFLRSIALPAILGIIFLSVQVIEYSRLGQEGLILGGTDSRSIFGTAFFTLTGFHGTHVLIGVLWCIRLFFNSFNNKIDPTKDPFPVEFFGLYWHFVDVVWIFIFTIVYLI